MSHLENYAKFSGRRIQGKNQTVELRSGQEVDATDRYVETTIYDLLDEIHEVIDPDGLNSGNNPLNRRPIHEQNRVLWDKIEGLSQILMGMKRLQYFVSNSDDGQEEPIEYLIVR